jgi:predicted YcjX-like family ATPase
MPPTTPEPKVTEVTTVHDQTKLHPAKFRVNKKIIGPALMGLVILATGSFAVLVYITNNITPDERLYEFKTTVVEKIIKATKLSADSKLEYTNSLLEKRVAELLALANDQSTSTPETLDRLASLTQQHVGDSVWMIENTNSLSSQEKILALAAITNTTRAFESLTDESDEFESITDYSSDIQDLSQDGLRAEIKKFASSSDTTIISAFIGEQITTIGEEIKTVAPNSRAELLARARIENAGEYIASAEFADAIYALFRARQAIAIDQYLYAAERGEGITETPATDTIPEGS